MSSIEDVISAGEFLDIPFLDDSMLDLYKTSGNPQNVLSSAKTYLKRIGQVPLLKP
jgi:hypothetical protein